jgi:hypothetical protein
MEDRPSLCHDPLTVNPVRGRQLFRRCHGRSRGAVPSLFVYSEIIQYLSEWLSFYFWRYWISMKEREVRDSTYREVLSSFDITILHGKRSRRQQDHKEEMHKASIIERKVGEKIIYEGHCLSRSLLKPLYFFLSSDWELCITKWRKEFDSYRKRKEERRKEIATVYCV